MSLISERINSTVYKFDSLVHLLEARAADRPEQLAYTFLRDGEVEDSQLSYGELAHKARAVGAWLQERNLQNRNVLLLYPPSLEYIVAFWGCLYAGELEECVTLLTCFTLSIPSRSHANGYRLSYHRL